MAVVESLSTRAHVFPMEAAVRWSPHSTGAPRRFLLVDVADASLGLHEVDDGIASGKLNHHPVASCRKLPSFGAFAWSPSREDIVALGHVSGNASLVQLDGQKQAPDPLVTFKTKQQRRCNSVAFSTQNWLAVALDKTRSDVCLNIYDAASDSASFSEPLRRLCPAEVVSSVRFFAGQPQELVASTQRSYIRVYDLRGRPHVKQFEELGKGLI